MDAFTVTANECQQTELIASVVAQEFHAGDVVLMQGPLGSGKTVFIKKVAAVLGSQDLVTSPTFTLANFYSTAGPSILHVDAYRLSGLPEYRDLALDEYIDTHITLVEWGEKIAQEFSCHLLVSLKTIPGFMDMRKILISSNCARWTSILPALKSAIARNVGIARAVY